MDDLEAELMQFTGTEHYYRHWMGFNYTDGVKYLADKAQSHWLLDAIGSYQPQLKNAPFQVWKLKVSKDSKAVLEMREDSDKPILVKQDIPYTDFPLEQIVLYFTDNVLLLTGEY